MSVGNHAFNFTLWGESCHQGKVTSSANRNWGKGGGRGNELLEKLRAYLRVSKRGCARKGGRSQSRGEVKIVFCPLWVEERWGQRSGSQEKEIFGA